MVVIEAHDVLTDRQKDVYGDDVLPDIDNIPKTSFPDSRVDLAIIAILSADPGTARIEAYGQAGFPTPSKVTVIKEGKASVLFMKTGPDGESYQLCAKYLLSLIPQIGEHESLTAMHSSVLSFFPKSIAHGKLSNSVDYFLLTEFIDMEAASDGQSKSWFIVCSKARKIAQLPSTEFERIYPAGLWLSCHDLHWSHESKQCMESFLAQVLCRKPPPRCLQSPREKTCK